MSEKRKLTKQQFLIKKFVNIEFCSSHKYFWPQQSKIANQLIKKYTFEFMDWMKPPHDYKITSLVWFLTKEGQDYLSTELVEYKKETIDLSPVLTDTILSDDKIGEDLVIKQKPKTLKDFLQQYN